MDSLMNGTQSGKTFFFLDLMMIMTVFLVLPAFFSKKRYLEVGILDKLLLIYVLYVIGNGYLHDSSLSLRLFEFYGLIILYVALRQIHGYNVLLIYAALILGGGIQAIYGNLQLWGYYPSHHSLFKITGTFFNPGPYAGYLVSVFPVALGFYIFKIRLPTSKRTLIINRFIKKADVFLRCITRKRSKLIFPRLITHINTEELTEERLNRQKLTNIKLTEALILIIAAFMILAVFATASRAGCLAILLASTYLLFMRYKSRANLLLKQFNSPAKKTGIAAIAIILAGFLSVGLYHLKKGSADGRLLIWKVGLNMIKAKPVFGHGFDQFKANYMEYQAAFFEHSPDSDKVTGAGDTNYAFNEIFQQIIENGIIGLVLIVLILMIIFTWRAGNNQMLKHRVSNETNQGQRTNSNALCMIAKAGIISIFIFSLFSYPAQILPIKTSLVLYLATMANNSSQTRFSLFNISHTNSYHQLALTGKIALTLTMLPLVYAGYKSLNTRIVAYRNWKNAYQNYEREDYDACLRNYEKAYETLKDNGDFLTNYGKAASIAGKPTKALELLNQAKKLYPNTVVYTAMGDSYKSLNRYAEAEHAYFHAWYMNPSRFYPKYLLVKLYTESGQKEKAFNMANELLDKKIKVESEAINEIKAEMQKLSRKGNDVE